MLHSGDASPLTYTEATLIRHGLRKDGIAKTFANLIRRKLRERKDFGKTCGSKAATPSEFLRSLNESKPLSCLINAISWSVNLKHRKHNDGYVQAPISAQAEKTSMVAERLERLIANKRTPTTTSLHLTVHWITGSKEVTTSLDCRGVKIYYNDVQLVTKYWVSCITLIHRGMILPGFSSNEPIHATFENFDGRQQTITGGQTIHHVAGTIVQVKSDNNNIEYPEKGWRNRFWIIQSFQEKSITTKSSKF